MRTESSVCRSLLSRGFLCLFALCLLLAQARSAVAQSGPGSEVGVVFTPDTMTAMPGDLVNYTAVFTNNTETDLYITSATFNSTDANLFNTDPSTGGYGNDGFFNGNGIGDGSFELAANSNLTVTNVASLFLSSTVPDGKYDINATFTGRNFSDKDDPLVKDRDLGTGPLSVTITSPVPELGTFWALGGLLLAGGAGLWRQRRPSVPCRDAFQDA